MARCDGNGQEIAGDLPTEFMEGRPESTRRLLRWSWVCAQHSLGVAQRLADCADAGKVLDNLEQRNVFTRRLGRRRESSRRRGLR